MTTVTESLPRSPDSVRIARRLVETHAGELGEQRRKDAGLMVSELVTNALRHGRGAITLRIDCAPDHVRVEVTDEGNGTIALNPAPGSRGGWGMHVVDRLTDEWGVLEGSTLVWFRLDFGKPPRDL